MSLDPDAPATEKETRRAKSRSRCQRNWPADRRIQRDDAATDFAPFRVRRREQSGLLRSTDIGTCDTHRQTTPSKRGTPARDRSCPKGSYADRRRTASAQTTITESDQDPAAYQPPRCPQRIFDATAKFNRRRQSRQHRRAERIQSETELSSVGSRRRSENSIRSADPEAVHQFHPHAIWLSREPTFSEKLRSRFRSHAATATHSRPCSLP